MRAVWTQSVDSPSVDGAPVLPRQAPKGSDFRDTRYRWSGTITYKRLATNPRDYEQRIDFEGPMSASGKPHREWKTTIWSKLFAKEGHQTQFYWYGEQISEGEWHLRKSK